MTWEHDGRRGRVRFDGAEQSGFALMSTAAIARTLRISSLTVKTHVRSLLAKLDAHSQLQAVAKAQTLGIVQANSGIANDRLTT